MLDTKISLGLSIALVAFVLTITACDENTQSTPTTSQTGIQSSWKLDTMPEGAIAVAQAKADAEEGQQITLVGRIGGRHEPITTSSGLFIVMDPTVPTCSDNPDDKCATPWDYCCETSETITANAATIQLRDAEGNSVALDEADLQPLDHVVIVGTVASRPNNDILIVHATGVYVVMDQ